MTKGCCLFIASSFSFFLYAIPIFLETVELWISFVQRAEACYQICFDIETFSNAIDFEKMDANYVAIGTEV